MADAHKRYIYQQLRASTIKRVVIPEQFKAKFREIFEREIMNAKSYKTPRRKDQRKYQLQKKLRWFCWTMAALMKSRAENGCVRYSRNTNNKQTCSSYLQVIDCLTDCGYCENIVSPKWASQQSRIVPLPLIDKLRPNDPWMLDPNTRKNFVVVRYSKTRKELEFDRDHPTPIVYQERLQLINYVNSLWRIEYRPWNDETKVFGLPLRLRPVHYAVFNRDEKYDDFEVGGRIYCGRYAHQNLRKTERPTITFDMNKKLNSVELDYSCLHGRMLYHLKGNKYENDLYQLDGVNPAARDLVKLVFNTSINAGDRHETIGSCIKTLKIDKGKGQMENWQRIGEGENAMRTNKDMWIEI